MGITTPLQLQMLMDAYYREENVYHYPSYVEAANLLLSHKLVRAVDFEGPTYTSVKVKGITGRGIRQFEKILNAAGELVPEEEPKRSCWEVETPKPKLKPLQVLNFVNQNPKFLAIEGNIVAELMSPNGHSMDGKILGAPKGWPHSYVDLLNQAIKEKYETETTT